MIVQQQLKEIESDSRTGMSYKLMCCKSFVIKEFCSYKISWELKIKG